MSKFKVGDRVSVIDGGDTCSIYKFLIEKHAIEFAHLFKNGYCPPKGDVGTVIKIKRKMRTKSELCVVKTDNHIFIIWDKGLKLLAQPKIIITTDGKTTTAKLCEGKAHIKTTTAKCNPDDKFDFEVGAKLAFNRLMYGTDYHPAEVALKEKPVKSEYYNGKVVCVDDAGGYHTIGCVYRIIDGCLFGDNAITFKNGYFSLEHINERLSSKFIAYKGEA